MKYVSIDTETTGLLNEDPKILSIGLIVDDLSDPKPYEELNKLEICVKHSKITGGIFAINMNQELISDIINETPKPDRVYIPATRYIEEMYKFIEDSLSVDLYRMFNQGSDSINVAGKCFATFDDCLLKNVTGTYNGWERNRKRRMLDPAILYFEQGDTELPNLKKCLKRAGMEPTDHHNALGDAWDVCRLLRHKLA